MFSISFLKEKLISRKIFSIILIAVLGITLYANTLDNELFWDDDQFIIENQYIKNWDYFPNFFSENLIAGAGRSSDYWRPALLTVFSFEWHMWGANRFGFHMTNTLFHITDAILLFFILDKIFKKRLFSLFIAIIFLIHPLQTEAVSYANSLGDSLSVFFILSSIFLFIKFRENNVKAIHSPYYICSLISFALALMSKETAIITPFLITLTDVFLENPKGRIKDIIWKSLPFYFMGMGYVLLRATVLNFVNTFNLYNETNTFTGSIFVRFLTFLKILVVYVSLIFWPHTLHMERNIDAATSLLNPQVLAGGFLLVTLLIIAFKAYKKYPTISFGILWFFIALSPTSNILVPINGMLYEHWLYVPLIGIGIVVWELGNMLVYKFPNLKNTVLIFTIILIITLCVRTILRNNEWDNSITFYQHVLKYSPGSYRIINNLGMELAEKGRYGEAKEAYLKAINLDNKNPVSYHNLANAYRDTNEINKAIENYEKAISLDSKFYYSYGALVNIYLIQENYIEAEKSLKKYIEIVGPEPVLEEALQKIQELKKKQLN